MERLIIPLTATLATLGASGYLIITHAMQAITPYFAG